MFFCFHFDIIISTGDNDPRLGASSFQQFEGEDLDFQKHKVRQQQQQAAAIEQQIVEKGVLASQEAALEAQNAERVKQIIALQTEVENKGIAIREQIESIRSQPNAEIIQKKKEQLSEVLTSY